MKNYFKHIFRHKFLTLVVIISSFLLGFTIANLVNTYTGTYTISFSVASTNDISFDEMITKEYMLKVKESMNSNYSDIDTNKIANEKGINISKQEDGNYILKTSSSYYPNFFLKSSTSVSTRAKTFLKTLINTYAEDNQYEITYLNKDIIDSYVPLSLGGIIGISCASMFVFTLIYGFVKYKIYLKHINDEELPYDNDQTFLTPFHKKYWKEVFHTFKSVKNISIIAMLLSLMILCKLISLPSGFGNLGLSLTYIVFATASMIFGPFAGFIIGILSDTIGYFLFQTGSTYFIGYMFQAAFTGMIYGLLLYRTKLTYTRCFISRIIVNLIMNVVYGSICWGIVAGYTVSQTYYYALIFSLPKNLVYLVPQSILLYLILKSLSPALVRLGLIKKSQYQYYVKKEQIEPTN
jgi:ECF transporter S component (folate family)